MAVLESVVELDGFGGTGGNGDISMVLEVPWEWVVWGVPWKCVDLKGTLEIDRFQKDADRF